MKDVLIIGGGPVGIFSIFACGMQNLSCVLVDALDELGGQCAKIYPEKAIYDIPGYPKITGRELVNNLIEQARPFKADIVLNSAIEKIEKEDGIFKAKTASGLVIEAKAIIIAAGSGIFEPNRPNLEGILEQENKSVFYYVENFGIFKNKVVAIAGGGDSAIDWCLEISKIASKIYLIHRRDAFKAHPSSLSEVSELGNVEKLIPNTIKALMIENEELKGLI
jgi:thioredoxin reductase (NADPH)